MQVGTETFPNEFTSGDGKPAHKVGVLAAGGLLLALGSYWSTLEWEPGTPNGSEGSCSHYSALH